jgi:hypothetical protein
MRNNQIKNKITLLVLATLLLASGIINFILTDNNQQLQNQIELRDSTLNEINIADSILCSQSVKNTEIIEKYINNCSFLLNGKEITSEELILYIQQINDSLKIYKSVYNLTKQNLNVDFNISEIDNGKIVTLEVPHDSLKKYKILYEMAEKEYGFKYITKKDKEDLIILKEFTKVDSALIVFEYYRDKLFRAEDGRWGIITERKVKK